MKNLLLIILLLPGLAFPIKTREKIHTEYNQAIEDFLNALEDGHTTADKNANSYVLWIKARDDFITAYNNYDDIVRCKTSFRKTAH